MFRSSRKFKERIQALALLLAVGGCSVQALAAQSIRIAIDGHVRNASSVLQPDFPTDTPFELEVFYEATDTATLNTSNASIFRNVVTGVSLVFPTLGREYAATGCTASSTCPNEIAFTENSVGDFISLVVAIDGPPAAGLPVARLVVQFFGPSTTFDLPVSLGLIDPNLCCTSGLGIVFDAPSGPDPGLVFERESITIGNPSSNFVFTRIVDTATTVPGTSFEFDGLTPPNLEDGRITFRGFGTSPDGSERRQGIYEHSNETKTAVDFSGDSGERHGPTGTLQQGWKFTANSDLMVQQLGIYDENGDGLAGDHLVQLWAGDGSEVLASVMIPAGTGSTLDSNFRFESIPEVHLIAGQSYAVTAYYPGFPCCNQDALYSAASTADFAPELTFLTSLGLANSSPSTFPTPSVAGQGFFGPNFIFTSQSLTVLADDTTPLPNEGEGHFTNFSGDLTRDGGLLGFQAGGVTAGGSFRSGIFTGNEGQLNYLIGNDSGTPVPFFTRPFRSAYQPTLDDGRLGFQGYGEDYYLYQVCRYFFGLRCETRSVTRSVRGIYSKVGEDILRVADSNTAVPGGWGTFLYFCRASADNGSTAFGGYSLQSDGNYWLGIYTDQGGTLRRVADQGTSLPGGGTFDWIDYCSPSKSGNNIAFSGQTSTPSGSRRSAVYAEIDGNLTRLVDSSLAIPLGTASLESFFSLSLDGENLAFGGRWQDPGARGAYRQGVFLRESGQLFQVLASGDQLDEKTVSAVDTLPDGALQGSRVGLRVQFLETAPEGRPYQALYVAALDRDADKIPDETDNCPLVANDDQIDSDADGEGDACEDFDMDLVFDNVDNCPLDSNSDQLNNDGDPRGNACDNCPYDDNPDQSDLDADGVGDVCDPDDDNDETLDEFDNCPLIPNDQSDLDLDGLGDACDADDDGDGILDLIDGQFSAGSFLDEKDIVSDNFTDQHQGGSSFGSVTSRGGLDLRISNHEDPSLGIQIDAVAGNGTAQIAICGLKGNQGRLRLNWGDSAVVTCGSATIQTLTDEVELLLGPDDEGIVVRFLNGVTATLKELADDQFSLANHQLSPDDVLMSLGGVEVTVPTAAIASVREIGDGLFEIESPTDSLQAVTATVGGQTVEFTPGQMSAIAVAIDIKPGSETNAINAGSGGNTPVAIFSSSSFDATRVDPLSVRLASAPVRLRGNGVSQSSFEDINGDGLLDLLVHVDTRALELSETAVFAVLEGRTFDDHQIRGRDTVIVIP